MKAIVHRCRAGRGFSLVEVMIAVFVIAVGLLGMGKMQALAISSTKNASVRSIAALQATSLTAAMRANGAYWSAGLAPASVTVTGTTLGDATLNAQTTDCSAAVCTPVQMAAFDLRAWGTNLAASFPSGSGAVSCTTSLSAPISCTVTVNWVERTVGINSAAAGTSATTLSYNLLVQP